MFKVLTSLFGAEKPASKKKPAAKAKAAGSAREAALANIRDQSDRVMTPERAALIQNALAVRRAKQKILADLSDEQRAKLVMMAFLKLVDEGKTKG